MSKPKKQKKNRPAGNKLITIASPVAPDLQVVVASELADDEMLEKEMAGEILPHFIYQFDQDGKKVTGLSVKGVNEVVRRLGKNPKSGSKIRISPDHIVIERDVMYGPDKGVEVRVYAEDLVTGNSAWGTKFEPYMKTGRRGAYANTFALEKALSKAERNAKRKLIPEVLATKMIENMIRTEPNTVKQIAPPPRQVQRVEAPKQEASTPAEMDKKIKNWINTSTDIDRMLTWIDEMKRTKKDPKNVAEYDRLISLRVDFLQSK